jgi:small subunit ribosomal protein S9
MAGLDYIWATGRRKTASAQVRIRPGTGKIEVNGKPFETYFPVSAQRGYIMQPLQVSGTLDKFDIVVSVRGGGTMGQAGAFRHGLSRALLKTDATYREVLKTSGMLTRDPREKERKKPGQPGARKR